LPISTLFPYTTLFRSPSRVTTSDQRTGFSNTAKYLIRSILSSSADSLNRCTFRGSVAQEYYSRFPQIERSSARHAEPLLLPAPRKKSGDVASRSLCERV